MKSLTTFTILLTIILTSLSSCTSYQYAMLESNLPQSQHKDFFFENDTLQIVYSFEGNNCPLKIDIYNKLNKPLHINWAQSAIITNGQTMPLKENISFYSGSIDAITYKSTNNTSITTGTNNGSIQHPDNNGFIPPKSQLKVNTINLCHAFINTTNPDSTVYTNLYTDKSPTPFKIKNHRYSAESSPLDFRCFISYSTNTSPDSLSIADNNFWVSNVFKTTSQAVYPRKDQFYISKISGVGGVLLCISAISIIAVIASIDTDPEL